MNALGGAPPAPPRVARDPDDPRALHSPARLALFRLYLHALFWQRFSAVRLSRGSHRPDHAGRPLLVYTNHPSWWDPALIGLVSNKLFPGRIGYGPMDSGELRRYALLRRFGAFGIEPTARGAARFLRLGGELLQDPNNIIWVTAEGRFTDPRRRPIVLRPGIAHLASRMPRALYVPAAIEYVFWNESRPEALLRLGRPVEQPAGSAPETWRAAMTAALEACADTLAEESTARDSALFTTLLHGSAGTGLYNLVRRARGDRIRHDAGNV